MAKLGDTRSCRACGGRAVLRIVRPPAAALGWADGCSIPYDVPSTPLWQCDSCDDRQPFIGDLEG